jgi:hypothetical protein
MPRLNSTGKSCCEPGDLQQLEVLRVAGADLDHHAGRVAAGAQRVADLVDLRLVGDLHRDHLLIVLAGELEADTAGSFLPWP